MSSNATIPGMGSSPPVVPIPPIGPILKSTLINHTCLTLLFPLLLGLFYYSTPHSRRQPIFILNLITLALGFSLGVLADVSGVHSILFPQEMLPPRLFIAIGAIGTFQSMLADLTLFMRIIIVYPLRRVGHRRFILVTFLPIFLKIARTINFTLLLVITNNMLNNPVTRMNGYLAFVTSPSWKIEWAAQIVDNGYASFLFLWTIHSRGGANAYISRGGEVKSSLSYRFRVLFRIAFSNFVVPTIFSVVLLVISFVDARGAYIGDVAFVNSMVVTYGVVFATIWVGIENRQKSPLTSENYTTRSTNGIATRNSTRIARLPVTVVGPMIDSGNEDLDGSKEGFVVIDPEARDGITLVPMKRDMAHL